MMKTLSFFLTVSILVLSCLTCGDVTELQTIDGARISYSSVNNNQNHTDTDYCSPLCTCNCCGQPLAFNLKSITIKILKPALKTQKIIGYKEQFVSDFPQSIWQPPKLDIEFIG